MYSIWICTDTAQKRANSIEKYSINREFLVGTNLDTPRYDILNAIVINISGKHDTSGTDNELIQMLTDLFDERMDGSAKVDKLRKYGLKLTKDVESEVSEMCTYATAMENKGIEKGRSQGISQGILKGKQQEKTDNTKRLAEYFMSQDSNLSRKDAMELAKGILK